MDSVDKFLFENIPGGFILFLFLFSALNLTLFFLYYSSGLFEKSAYLKKTWQGNALVLSIYIFFWIALRPAALPDRIVILPLLTENSYDFVFSDVIQQELKTEIQDEYVLHPWQWFYQTAKKDSLNSNKYLKKLAENLAAKYIISGRSIKTENGFAVTCRISEGQKSDSVNIYNATFERIIVRVMQFLNKKLELQNQNGNNEIIDEGDAENLVNTQIMILNKEFEKAENFPHRESHREKLLKAEILLHKGIQKAQNTESNPMEKQDNEHFRQIRQMLFPYLKEEKDTAEINRILGEMFLFEKDYSSAEVFLKKAMIQDRFDARIYYLMSFLEISRLRELGFKNRIDVLHKAIEADPGYVDSVFELASEYFDRGNASIYAQGTKNASKILEDFLRINDSKIKILNLIADIYVRTKSTAKAIELYQRIEKLSPGMAENQYNLGICYFHIKQYDLAERHFQRAIEINDYANAYLYLGGISRIRGDEKTALRFFRERIKRKINDDDYYAKQAMQGIRKIMNKMNENAEQMFESPADSL